jgi:hypothetical protein
MTPTWIQTSFAFSAAVALLLPAGLAAQVAEPPVQELKRLVEQREEELKDAQAALASARARLAKAEGKKELAAAEGRKVLTHHENRLKAAEKMFATGRFCTDEFLQEAMGAVAIARVWLAEVEGRRDELLTELPKVIAYYEYRVRLYKSLLKFQVIAEKEAQEALKQFGEELRLARERLAALQKAPASQGKTGKDSKP